MAALSVQVPYPVFYDRDGQPLDNGNIYIGVANLDAVTNPLQVYYDEALTITASQPLITSNGYVYRNGTPAQLYVNATNFSILVNDSKNLLVYNFPDGTGLGVGASSIAFTGFNGQVGTIADLGDADGSDWIGYTPTGTGATARTAQAKMRDIISIKDFGVVGDGSDETVKIQAAFAAAAGRALYIPATASGYRVTSAISIASNTEVYGDGSGSIIQCSTADINVLLATSASNVHIHDIKINITATPGVTAIGAIKLDSCSHCTVNNCEIVGTQWAGVWLNNTTRSTVFNNYFHDFLGSSQDAADVCVYRNSSYNLIDGNQCYGGNWHGILVQDPGSATLPYKNIVSNNNIGAHLAYGIIVYQVTAADVFTQVRGNFIENIDGAVLGGSAGAGIYVVAAGGVEIANNVIRNCCISTTNQTLAPGGIGINGIDTTLVPPNIVGNTISDMAKYHGILINSSSNGANVIGNTVRTGMDATCTAIACQNSSNTNIQGNRCDASVTSSIDMILVYASALSISNINVNGNVCRGGNYAHIDVLRVSANTITNVSIVGNTGYGGGASCISMRLSSITGGSVTGNSCSSTTVVAFSLQSCTEMSIESNSFQSTGANGASTSGTNTGSTMGKSNKINGTGDSTGTGLISEFYATAVPSAGSHLVGDHAVRSVPTAAATPGWYCTASGTPGTWKAEANIAA